MKTVKLFFIISVAVLFSSCELDNYDGPDSKFHGNIIDSETNEQIQQDLMDGSQISYLELGWRNENPSYLRFHADGSFCNNLMFAGEYEIRPVRGNFHPIPKETIKIEGDTKHDFYTLPYIRINDAKINLSNGKAIATFKVEQVGDAQGYPVVSMILCCDMTESVGYPISNGGLVEIKPNIITDPNTEYKIEMLLSKDKIKRNGEYYFRIGAKTECVSEVKYNYSKPIKLYLNLY